MGAFAISRLLENLKHCQIDRKTIEIPFACGDNDLDDFYKNDAILYQEDLIAKTYIIYKDNKIVSFYSLLNDNINSKNENVSKEAFKKIKKKFRHRKQFSSYPAIKIGRFAVSSDCQKKGIGKSILDFILCNIAGNKQNSSACRFITVDAYEKVIGFYEKCGFGPLRNNVSSGTLPMYYDLKQIENSLI